MEGRKTRREQRQNEQVKNVKKGSNSNIIGIISKLAMILLTVVLTGVFGIVIYLKVLPNKYLIPLCALLLVISAGGIFLTFRKKTSNKIKVVLSIVGIILVGVFSFIGLKLMKTLDFLDDMTTETVNAKTYSVLVIKESEYTKLEDIQYKMLLYYDTELNQNQNAIDKLTNAMTVVAEKTDDVHELANKLLEKQVDAILIEDSYYAIIEEEIEDFKEKTKVIYTFALEDAIQTIAKDVSVTDEPFVVYVSGIDSYGKISSVARSDVNMLAVINPKTGQILLVNTPRDYYVKLHGTSGYRDKLTHAGIYGIDMSVKTMEDLYDVDINYYVRVNFTSLIKIIDAIGGVNVYSEYNFTSRIGKYKFKKGYNQMSGKQALGFARERYSFADGDRMRGQNQQAVIDAMVKKVCSSKTILTRFDALLDSLKGSFQTNMEYTKMLDLVRMQIAEGIEWNITSISVDGAGSRERTYSMGKTRLSVLIPYAGSINKAESMIKSVLDGEMLEQGNIDLSAYNDRLVVSRGIYEEEEEKPKEEPEQQPETGDNVVDETPPVDNENNENNENTGDGNQSGENTGDNTTPGGSENIPGRNESDNGNSDGGSSEGNTQDKPGENTGEVEQPENNNSNNNAGGNNENSGVENNTQESAPTDNTEKEE